jgi:hypothetical protein
MMFIARSSSWVCDNCCDNIGYLAFAHPPVQGAARPIAASKPLKFREKMWQQIETFLTRLGS